MDREQFMQGFLTRLDGRISDEALKVVAEELGIYVGFFDISLKETALALLDVIPESMKAFLVSKKIEGLSDTTIKNYGCQLARFFSFVRKTPDDVTANDIRMWLYFCQHNEGVSGVTVNNKRGVLNSFFTWCKDEGYVSENPCRKIGKIKFCKKERMPLTKTELEMVRDACKIERDRALVEFLYSTGCRVSELINVRTAEVDFERGELRVIGKGNKERTVYLNERSVYFIRKYLATRSDETEYLFVSKNEPHRKLSPTSVHYILEQIGTRAGLPRRLHPHLIQHTTATNAVDNGIPIVELQKILGHNSLNTTMIYAKVMDENVKAHHRTCIV